MSEETMTTATGAETATAADNGAATAEAKTLLDGATEDTQAEAKAETPADTKSAPAATRSLLDDEPEPAQDAKAEEANAAPTEEQVTEFVKGIPALDLGEGVTWSDATLRAVAPALMELTGGDAKRAQGVVKAYADYSAAQAKAQSEAAEAFNAGLIKECENRFGEDLRKVAALARRGGREVFGDRLWNEMKTIPQFANNPDIMERLAEVGRRYAPDTGKVTPKDGVGETDRGDVLHRMYGSVRV